MLADLPCDDRIFQAVPVESGTARRAFALARLLDRQIGMREWLDYTKDCRRGARGAAGLTGLIDRRGYVHAFFAWTVRATLGHGRTLRIFDLVVGHLPGRSLCDALLDTIEDLARSAACTTIVLEPTNSGLSTSQRAAFLEAGFSAIPSDRYLIGRRLCGPEQPQADSSVTPAHN